MATQIEAPVATFHGIDGREHRIGYVTGRGGRGFNAGPILVDEYEGHGLRVLCILKAGDDSVAQMEAVIREYRVCAATADRPLSRRVKPEEISQTRADSYAVAG